MSIEIPDVPVLPDASLSQRVRLLTGANSWALHPLPSRDLRPIVLSDGPIGVRGVDEDDSASAQLPSPSALAATWDRALLRTLGFLLATEARRKRVDVILAPVVNLQRTPHSGRHFEMFSEDPYLTGELALVLIRTVQDAGVGMCVKHFLGNESETERTTYVARIGERALREVYLAPFERAVKDGGAWSVMAAYNGVDDGVASGPATEHASLLLDVLKGEWGFDGVVVSDWLATKSTVESALGGLDLVMPGPTGPWGEALEDAVRSGAVAERVIDDKVDRIVRLGQRVGAITASSPTVPSAEPDAASVRRLLQEAVSRSMVVLRNNGILPLSVDRVPSIALIGPNAVEPFVQGGGSASVSAPLLSSPLDGLADLLPNTRITLHRGVDSRAHGRAIDPARVTTPHGDPGYAITFLDDAGASLGPARSVPAHEAWNREPPVGAASAVISAGIRLQEAGTHRLQIGVSGAHRISIDGEVVAQSAVHADHDVILDSSANNPSGPVREFVIDEPRTVRVESQQQVVDAGAYGRFVRFALRHDLVNQPAAEELAEAVDAARAADVAIVIVGTNDESESEGWDRTTLSLPGNQDQLVEQVIAANQNTIVVVDAGSPVVLPWLEQAAGVLWWWLPGQEAGTGLAAALLNHTEPSGRLPWTLPATERDVPVRDTRPNSGVLEYSEGIHVGYREWDRRHLNPAREFGYGLGYGDWRYDAVTLSGDLDSLTAVVVVTNIGAVTSRETVQLYLEAVDAAIERPARWLAGFDTVEVRPGDTATVRIPVECRQFQVWDTATHAWTTPDGSYRLHAAHTSRDLRATSTLTISNGLLTY